MQVLSGCALTASTFSLLALGFPDTGEEVVDSTRSELHRVILWIISTASVGVFVQLLVVLGRLLHMEFATSHASLVHILVSSEKNLKV